MTTHRNGSRFARAILHRIVKDEALAGDLLEEFDAGRSLFWLGRQLLAAVWCALVQRHASGRELGAIVNPSGDPQVVGLALVIFGAAAEIVEMARSGIWWVAPVVLGGAVLTSMLKVWAHHRTGSPAASVLLG